ncbi:MAG: gliding motility-associated C-terminal domain-containing protein [Bacteroidota bacterium]
MRIENLLNTARWKQLVFALGLICLLWTPARATHIVGAELYYECINPNTNSYQITLRMLRDCLTGQAEFDDSIYVFVFPSANPTNVTWYPIPLPLNTPTVEPTNWDDCVGQPYPLCVEEAIYTRIVTLQPVTGGYDLGWARCCRNQNIDNLFNPLDQGVTFLAHIPGPEDADCNSMPNFTNQMPTFICVGEEFYFDHSATDQDGDSLVYSLTRPYDGLNFQGIGAGNANVGNPPPVVDPQNLMGPPPYQFVTYSSPAFTATDPFGPNSASIDPATGVLRIEAPNIGVYVVAISVFEYRNGVLLSENKKDLQIHVVQCLPQNDPPDIAHVFNPQDSVNGDTLILNSVDTTCYTVTVSDINGDSLAAQPISAIFSGANAPTVNITGSNPLTLDVCWESNCDFSGATIELIIMGWDLANCPIYNPGFDTVFIRILPPPDVIPDVDHQLPPSNPMGPDTMVVEVGSTGCFDMWITDTIGLGGIPTYNYTVTDLSGGAPLNLNVTPTTFTDSTHLEICWEAGCENRDRVYRVVLDGILPDACPPNNRGDDTVYLFIPAVPNPPPVTSVSFQGGNFSGDTLFIDVHDTACFTVVVNDTFPGLDLNLDAELFAVDNLPTGGLGVTTNIIQDGDSLVVEVCWVTSCVNVDRLFELVLTGIQDNLCQQEADDLDNLFIQVNNVVNPPPEISHTFLPGYEVDGDTIYIAADSAACYEFALRDSGMNTYLIAEAHTELLATLDSTFHQVDVTLTDSSDTLIAGTVCFTPGCEFLDETLLVILTGRDTFDCSEANWVYDTVYIQVVEPTNSPPVIEHFLDGLNVVGGVVEVIPNGEPYCYRVELSDPDSSQAALTAEGVSYIFDEWFRYGNPAEVEISGTNPLIISVCWDPSCYDSGEEFDLVIVGRDTSRCGLTPSARDSVRFRVGDCTVEVQNVFSPNGDGINDEFIPYEVQGVDYYRMQIFDRWGTEIFQSDDGRWDGTKGDTGRNMPAGVYYYIFEYQFYSARGVPLKERSVGWVTLVR